MCTTLPRERGGSWPPHRHYYHPPTSPYERSGPGHVTFTSTTRLLEHVGTRPPYHHLHLPPFHPSAETRPRRHPSRPSEGPDPTMLPRHPPPSRSSAQGPGRLIITTTSHLSTPLSRPGHVTASPTTLPLECVGTRPPHHNHHLPPLHDSAETRPRRHPSRSSEGPYPTTLPRHPPPSRSTAEGPGPLITTTTTLPPLDTSAVDPAMSPSPSPPSRSSAEGLPGPGHHLHHPPTSRYEHGGPGHVTSPPHL